MNQCTKTLLVIGLLVVLFCSGCAGRKAIVKDTFLLDVQRQQAPATATAGTVLSVQPFSIAPAFQGKGLVYRTGDNQYESDYYNEYFVSPSAMMTEQTRDWLSESNLFHRVLAPVSMVEPTHVLEGHIKQIGADLRDKSQPQATLEISFFLLDQNRHNRAIRFQKTYLVTEPLDRKTALACVDAMNRCLEQILGNLEKDLVSNLSKK
jgi:ABC-type uncharacterized transport system auxiliary subunit